MRKWKRSFSVSCSTLSSLSKHIKMEDYLEFEKSIAALEKKIIDLELNDNEKDWFEKGVKSVKDAISGVNV